MDRPLVLLADDYVDACEMYSVGLRFFGFRVVTAFDGRAAVDAARRHRPDIVLLDIRMPGLTGIEALGVLKMDPAFTHVPIVALTAHALPDERESALRAGFDAFIAKPILPDQLADQLAAILGIDRPEPGMSEPVC
ncbi:MAG TPA: response regulator [Vicinamibacterales bacterium]|jgi:CheY-like chemotaxis protein|nr:response regulator [Vicinamibacterales bacterium]